MTDTYNKVAGALDESRALLAEVMAELAAAAERERVLREALEEAVRECEELRGALVWIVGLLPPGEYDMDAIDEAGAIARNALKPEATR